VHVDAAAVRTKRELDHWIELALDYNRRTAATKRKRR
jgi:TfoX/Sxy family transcriptional regulator of competence genes